MLLSGGGVGGGGADKQSDLLRAISVAITISPKNLKYIGLVRKRSSVLPNEWSH